MNAMRRPPRRRGRLCPRAHPSNGRSSRSGRPTSRRTGKCHAIAARMVGRSSRRDEGGARSSGRALEQRRRRRDPVGAALLRTCTEPTCRGACRMGCTAGPSCYLPARKRAQPVTTSWSARRVSIGGQLRSRGRPDAVGRDTRVRRGAGSPRGGERRRGRLPISPTSREIARLAGASSRSAAPGSGLSRADMRARRMNDTTCASPIGADEQTEWRMG